MAMKSTTTIEVWTDEVASGGKVELPGVGWTVHSAQTAAVGSTMVRVVAVRATAGRTRDDA